MKTFTCVVVRLGHSADRPTGSVMACKPVDPGLLAHIHALGPPFYLLRRPEFRTTTGAPWVGEESMKLCVQKTSPGSTSLPSRYRGGSRRCIRTCEAPHLRG